MPKPHMDVRPWTERVKARMDRDAKPRPEPKARPLQRDPDPAKIDRRAWLLALATPCPKGHAPADRACFDAGGVVGMCNERAKTLARPQVPTNNRVVTPAAGRGTTKEKR